LLVERILSGDPVAEVCRALGVSRVCAYKWVDRYIKEGESGLRDRSRRPHHSPNATPQAIVATLTTERERYPYWGARKIRRRVQNTSVEVPSERTVGRILKREGLISASASPADPAQRFSRLEPNQLWQIDYRGPVRGVWGCQAVPLVVLDDASRYLLGLWSLRNKTLALTWQRLWELFGAFGLPDALLSDNDSTFGGRAGPSQMEVRLMRLGVDVLHGRVYHPQTQGKVERLNGTLERELMRHYEFGEAEQLQSELDRFRLRYNFERPHEALGLEVPARVYRPSPRPRPNWLPELEYARGSVLRRVDVNGRISWKGQEIYLGDGLIKERVEVRESGEGTEIFYGAYLILKRDSAGRIKRLRSYHGWRAK
jgi:transposase InsO family protein